MVPAAIVIRFVNPLLVYAERILMPIVHRKFVPKKLAGKFPENR